MSSAFRWDYSKIKGFPEGCTIQKMGNHLYAIERKSVYSSAAGRSVDKERRNLGQVVDNVFYTTEEYKARFQRGMKPRRVPVISPSTAVPTAISSLPDELFAQLVKAECVDVDVGLLPILHKISKELGLMQDLTDVFGKSMADTLFVMAAFFIMTGDDVARRFDDWSKNRHLPISEPLTARDLSSVFSTIGANRERVSAFFTARVARNLAEPALLSVDSTTLSWNCGFSDKARVGKCKEGSYKRQLSYMVCFNTTTHQPLFYRVLPGNINDGQTVLDLMTRCEEYGLSNTATAVMDRGYGTDENILLATQSGMKCVFAMMIRPGTWINKSIDAARAQFSSDSKKHWLSQEKVLKDGRVQGATFQRRIKVNGHRITIYAHVFLSATERAAESARFFEALGKFEDLWSSRQERTKTLERNPLMEFFEIQDLGGKKILKRDDDAIKEHLKNAGIFADVTTWKCTAQECYDTYGYRCDVERVFRSGKSNAGMNVLRTHDDKTSEGKAFVSFLELTLLEEIKRRLASDQMKTIKSGKEHVEIAKNTFDFDEVLSGLASISYTKRKSTGALICREVTDRQRRMAIACGCRGIYDSAYAY